MTLALAGFGDVLLRHGMPRDDEEAVLVDTCAAFDPVEASAAVCRGFSPFRNRLLPIWQKIT